MRRIQMLTIILMLAITMAPANAARIEGVFFNDRYKAGGKMLTLRGVALLRYMVFIKAYVGAFYLDRNYPNRDAFKDVTKRLALQYFHAIPAKDFADSTMVMIEKNVSAQEFKTLRPLILKMNALYRDVQPGDRYVATYMPGVGTTLSLNDKVLGTVPGLAFANAFFSIWIGKHPIDKGFRDHLLGKNGS